MLINTWEYKGTKVKFTFYDGTNEKDFEPYTQSYGICFRDDGKILIGFSPNGFDNWLLPGGTREKGENGLDTLKRELDEELSLKIKKYKLLGAQKVDYLNVKKETHYQLRYVAIVNVNKLTPDPDNGLIWKRKAIDPKDFSKYLKWGNIGEHIIKEAVKWFKEEKIKEEKIARLSYRQGVQAYIVNDKDELLLVCNVSDGKFWKVPSGGVEKGESPKETVKREMREELGVNINIIKKMPFKNRFDWPEWVIIKQQYRYRGQEQSIFIVKISGNEKIKIAPKEVQDYKWVKFSKLNDVLKLEHQQVTAKKVLKEYEKIKNSCRNNI